MEKNTESLQPEIGRDGTIDHLRSGARSHHNPNHRKEKRRADIKETNKERNDPDKPSQPTIDHQKHNNLSN